MLDQFAQLIDSLRAYDFGAEMQQVVEENKDELVPMIQEQLEQGKDGADQPNTIFGRSGYSPKTVAYKEANGEGLGAVTDRITNYMTGAFYESLKIETEADAFEADSDVPYFGDITLYSSDQLLEVDEEHRLQFAESFTIPGIKASLLQKTGLEIT